MVSMKNIAQSCGVSIATVSKALNDHSDISERTKTKIINKAKELGYFPNASARALRTNKTYSLGVLFVDEANSGLTHDYFNNIINSAKVAAEEKGYDITFLNSITNKFRMSYLEHCRYRGLEGVIIACIDFEDIKVQELLNSELPVVTIDYLFEGRDAILSNNTEGMSELVNYIYNQGHRKIAYIHGEDSLTTRARVQSFHGFLASKGINVPDEYIAESAYRDVASAGERTKELLSHPNPPTCIIYPDDFSSMGGMNVIKEKGLKIPNDISIAGYDGIVMAEQLEPRLTTIKQDAKQIGREAAEKLIRSIEHPQDVTGGRTIVDSRLCYYAIKSNFKGSPHFVHGLFIER